MKHMLTLSGQLINIFHTPAGVTKKGDEYDSADRLQLLCETPTQTGELRMEMVDLKVKSAEKYRELVNTPVSLAVRTYVRGPREVGFFVLGLA